jgi:hypothetical protein
MKIPNLVLPIALLLFTIVPDMLRGQEPFEEARRLEDRVIAYRQAMGDVRASRMAYHGS